MRVIIAGASCACALVVFAGLFVRSAAAQDDLVGNLVGNPGFENGPSNPAPWSFSGDTFVADGANSNTGQYEAELPGIGPNMVSQVIATTAMQEYLVSFWVASDGWDPSFPDELAASFVSKDDISSVDLTNSDLYGTSPLAGENAHERGSYVQYSFDFFARTESTTLSFAGSDDYGNIWLDDVSVVPVPEPGSLLLFAIGGISVGIAAMRRGQCRC